MPKLIPPPVSLIPHKNTNHTAQKTIDEMQEKTERKRIVGGKVKTQKSRSKLKSGLTLKGRLRERRGKTGAV